MIDAKSFTNIRVLDANHDRPPSHTVERIKLTTHGFWMLDHARDVELLFAKPCELFGLCVLHCAECLVEAFAVVRCHLGSLREIREPIDIHTQLSK